MCWVVHYDEFGFEWGLLIQDDSIMSARLESETNENNEAQRRGNRLAILP